MAIFFVPFAVLAVWYLISSYLDGEQISVGDRITQMGGGAVFLWVLVLLFQHFRYRYSYNASYVIDTQGVRVSTSDQQRQFRWEEFDTVEYLPLFFLARLKGAHLERPLVLFLSTESPEAEARSLFTRNLFEEKMGSRYRRRWLP